MRSGGNKRWRRQWVTPSKEGKSLGKEPIMAYKKPQMVAKSVAKKSYVAGCPTNSRTEDGRSINQILNGCLNGTPCELSDSK